MKLNKLVFISTSLFISTVFFSNAMAEERRELNLGILGGQNATQQIGNNQCVKEFFDKHLNVDTKLRNASDYAGVIQGLLGGSVDLVISFSPSAFATVYLKDPNAVEIVGTMADDNDGSTGYHSVMVVKSDSPYQSLEDLKGKHVGFAEADSTSGFLIPDYEFKKQLGGTFDDNYNQYFSKVTFSGGHEQDILGVLNGQFDAAVTWTNLKGDPQKGYNSGAFTRMMNNGYPNLMNDIRVIWQSELIPNEPIVISNRLEPEFKQQVIDAIKKLDKEDHACFQKAVSGSLHIEPTTVEAYMPIIELKKGVSGRG
ncbi:phosphonate ABC transporter substrate-binding protein [Thorsellia anophelis]|uniref:Phosphonate transport system substrate-binding protein n=1 Tax=Thorsellia anophelis DSM 18579 TaxID=1123402 RepID=A0A1H9ZHQ8_9GAMM|nr:phosphonate ABC transporter substrate-binding protein [Thorsellia anophelis]SES81094.1 phosphonate transport system substrate-binding protein [Thorsellia anophelis DSM 18579]